MRTVVVVAAACASMVSGVVLPQDVLIRGATVHTVTARGVLKNADVLIREGRIASLGAGLPIPRGVAVVEAGGRPLTPGLFGGLSAIGLKEVSAEPDTVDSTLSFDTPAWQQQWRPEFDVSLGYNPRSTLIPVARIEGLTWTMLTPHSRESILAGQGRAIALDGRYDAFLGGSRTLFVNMGAAAISASGGSRAAQYMLLEQAIREVAAPGVNDAQALLHPAGREALARYLRGGRVVFQVERAADIRRVTDFARAHGIKPVISGGSEAWLVARELARDGVPVVLNPLQNLPDSFDRIGARLDNAALLQHAGVRIAFSEGETHHARRVRQLAGNAVAHGLSWDAALAALTANPAAIFGLGATRGRIAVGQVADLVLWSDDPLEVTSVADQVWIAGRPVDMRSRQTELRDRYVERQRYPAVMCIDVMSNRQAGA